MDDGETAADGLDFTPPDTPSQHYHHHPGSPMDGAAMGNSPSKDDAGAAAAAGSGSQGSSSNSQMSQSEDGGILASLGPLTSPSNPTGGDAGSGAKDDAAVGTAAAAAAADEDSDDADDEMTPSIDYNQDTEKFVPSASAQADAASNTKEHGGDDNNNNNVEEENAPAPAQEGGDCMSPLTMTEDQKDRGHDVEDGEEEEEEMEINSEDEAAIAQDGIYQPADGIAVGTIVGGGGGGGSQSNQGGPTGGSDDDDDEDDEEFGSMEAPLADTGGLLTQGGGFGEDSDEEDDSSSSDSRRNSARAGGVGSDDDSDAEERSQDLLGDDSDADEGHTHEEQEEIATEPAASAPSDTEQTATAEDTGASTAEVEAEAMDVDTGMFVTGLTEQSASQTQPALADGAADTEETGDGGIDTENAGANGDDDDGRGDDDSDDDDGAIVEGLTEQTETQTQPTISASTNSQQEDAGSGAAAADNSEVVPPSPLSATPLVEAEVAGLTEQSEWSQQDSQKTTAEGSHLGMDGAGSAKEPAAHGLDTADADNELMVGMTEQTEAAESPVETSHKVAAEDAGVNDAAVEAHSQKQHLSDAELMPPPATPHSRSPKKNRSAEIKADASSQRSLVSKLAEGSEDTYDSFGDLPVFSGDTEQMVMPSMDRFTANEDSPTKHGCSQLQSSQGTSKVAGDEKKKGDEGISENKSKSQSEPATDSNGAAKSQVEKEASQIEDDAKMPPSEDAVLSPGGETRSEQGQNHDTEEVQKGTGASSSPSSGAELGDLYDNAETERFQGSPDNRAGQDDLRDEEVDTNASTPLVSHTQTYIDGRSSAGFSYPRVDEIGSMEEKKIDSPSPVVPATPVQESHISGPKDSQNEVEDMDIGASMRSIDEEIAEDASGGGSESFPASTNSPPEASTPANSKKNPLGDPTTPAGAVLESEAATVMLSTTPASSKKMARDPVTPATATAAGTQAQASEATTVRLSTTPASTKERPEDVAAETSTPTKEIDPTSPASSDKPRTPASSERTTANSASSPNKSGLSFSSSPHSQPLLSPDAGAPPSSNLNSGSSSLFKSVEARSKAFAKHGHSDGKGLSQDDIVDSDEDTCEEPDHMDAVKSVFPKNHAASSRDAAPGPTDENKSAKADGGTKGEVAQKKGGNIASTKPTPTGATNSSGSKRTSAAPAQWIHKHQTSNQKKNAAADTHGEKDVSESEEGEEFDTEGGSEPTPRLFLPSGTKQRAAERKKELEVEADAFSSSDDDGMVARNARAAAAARHNKSNHALQDTQESASEGQDGSGEEVEKGENEKNPFASSARTSSARKRLKKRLRRDGNSDRESSPPSSVSSSEAKKKAKRQSSADYQVQDSLAMLGADAKHESSDEEEHEFVGDEIGDDASVSSSDYAMMPSQNTIDIDNLIGQAKGALQKFSERNADSQVAKLKRKVERLERKCSKMTEGYNKVRAENAVLKRSLEKKITQNQEMKVLLAKFNKMARAGTLQTMGDDNDAASESDSSIDSQTASPPATKKARRSIAASKKSSASKRQANKAGAPSAASATTAPVVVPPSSIKARGRSQAKMAPAPASSSTCDKKRKNEQNKSRPTRDDESSDDENTTLANLDTTPKAKRGGKKLNFERHNGSKAANSRSNGTGKKSKSPSATSVPTSNAANGRSRSRRGASSRDMRPKGMEHIRPSEIWQYLRDTHGWTWRQGPEPYNNVYVRPGIEHLNVVSINQDFYEDGNYLYAEAKKAGFLVEEMAEEEEEVGETGSQVDDDGIDADNANGDSAAEEAAVQSVQSEQRGRRRGGYAQKQVNAATSPNGVHVSLFVGDHSADDQDDEDNEKEKRVESASEEENFDAENTAESSAEEEEEEEGEIEEEESEDDDDDDSIIASLDDTDLCGDARILTPRSAHVCAKFIRKFAKLRKDDASFMNLLWEPMWGMLKEGQGGEDKEDLKWRWAKSKGMLAQRSFWYVAPQSKGSDGEHGVDYFETEEAVVLKVLQEIQIINSSLLEPSIEHVQAFETVLTRAVENNVAYIESRSNPDIGGRRRNRRKTTSDTSPFVYSAREKKARPSPTKTKAKTKKEAAVAKTKKKTKAATSPKSKPKLTSSLKMSPSPRKATKSVAFSEPPPLSQNTMEGAETLLMMISSGAASTTNSPNLQAAAAATSDEGNDTTRDSNPTSTTPNYEDIVTPKGIEALRAARLQSLQDVTPSPKKRSASPASGAKSGGASATSSGRKRQKTRSPTKEEAPSSIDTRLSQVPYQLCDSLDDMSQSQSDASSTFARRKSNNRANNGKMLPLNGLSFFGSGLDSKHADIIKTLGGEYLSDVSSLDDATIYGSLFFVSNVQQRRKLKYILASALGVPMLHYSWLKAIQTKYEAIEESEEDGDSKADAIKQLPYNSDLFKGMRLPVGLSIKSGLYHLQKARHAKRWCRPGQENGKLAFKGLKLAVALENSKFEPQWEAVLRAAGATIVKSSTLKNGKKCHLDALLVDRNSLPPHTTAVPSNISRCMNFVKNGNAKTTDGIAKIPIMDLSWALQCIVERERLAWDTDERYTLYSDASSSNENGDKMYEMKVKVDNIPVRFECGDIVEFGRTKSTERIGRIITIEGSKRTCATRNLEIQLLDRNGNFELVDGGESATRVKINENELRRHITLLGAKDFKDIRKGGYLPETEKETHIFLQKKPPSASSSK